MRNEPWIAWRVQGNGPSNTRKGYAAAVCGKAANGGRSTRKGYAAAVCGKAANGGRSTRKGYAAVLRISHPPLRGNA